jgi:hypothetical protein
MTDQRTWYDIAQAAEYSGQPVKRLRTAVGANRIRHIRSGRGGQLSFHREWIDAYMRSLESTASEAEAVSA